MLIPVRFSEIRIHTLHSNLSGGNLFMTYSYVLYIIPLSYRQCKFCLELKTNCQQEWGKQHAGLNSSLGDHTPWGLLTFLPQISGLRPGVAAKFAKGKCYTNTQPALAQANSQTVAQRFISDEQSNEKTKQLNTNT